MGYEEKPKTKRGEEREKGKEIKRDKNGKERERMRVVLTHRRRYYVIGIDIDDEDMLEYVR